eukprot:16435321-Heterocapsa_arctica.AAC.1
MGNCCNDPARRIGDLELATLGGIDCTRIIATEPPFADLAALFLSPLLAACMALSASLWVEAAG